MALPLVTLDMILLAALMRKECMNRAIVKQPPMVAITFPARSLYR